MRIKMTRNGDFRKVLDIKRIAVERAVGDAVRQSGSNLKQRLRGQTIGSGLGRRLANTWQNKNYPDQRISAASPASIVYSKAPKIIDGFSRGTPIKSKRGFFLAVPTDVAPKRGSDGKRIKPDNFPEWRFGRLEMVYRRNGPSFLVVNGSSITKSGRAGRRRKGGGRTKSGNYRKGTASVIMFLLYPQVRLPKVFKLDNERRRARADLQRNVRLRLQRMANGNR
ncbi:DUF6441 family protein [Thalassospira sp.]|uniref:DUF6441 family protein n=1 Tax=Thalassospira sp. TaxID=1912094 RepID=UPI000C488E74|nr:DUF6441 family protein [Thalassospira sp.]MBC05719.1 hypothetical protein [Thalassospira sp.]|tara:strand:+ start:9852 stop:10523 length:672 start_codon:yes stop_codon:yes gene_type:complete